MGYVLVYKRDLKIFLRRQMRISFVFRKVNYKKDRYSFHLMDMNSIGIMLRRRDTLAQQFLRNILHYLHPME
ncbi:hypothetical protein SDC9_189434 [bioreactor metagenome]|uniref:Uncharacterized protein n=1 Tax=bioreactor metagenome TaxID=1076179 RepID=A0A645HUL4_9ZZZZ